MTRPFSLVGPGRAGESVRIALEARGWTCVRSLGREDDVSGALESVELCVLAVPDDAIRPVAAAIRPNDGAVLLHLSGATPLDALAEHRAAAMHPLVSLVDPVQGAASLRTAWFAVAGDVLAEEIVHELSGKLFRIADEDRPLYHAAAAVASNHIVVVLAQAERLAAEAGVPPDAFQPLVRATLDNVAKVGAAEALTGPAARGDDKTIAAHVAALADRLPDELALYEMLVEHARLLADSREAD